VDPVRRLSAIMFTDTVGSTAAAQANESAALKLHAQQEEFVRPLFAAHHGRAIKSMGDGFLVEFDSALDAVYCAIEVQRLLHERNLSVGEDAKMRIRIGIHLGDVIRTAGDVLGDSVNIASRMEPLAEAGGICISEPVFGQVRNKIPNGLEKLEPRALKGVRFPLDVYRIVLPWTIVQPPAGGSGTSGLAVLPFGNISQDHADEYFADGLTEELITVLSQLEGLRVIARTSVMQYKSTTKSVSQIGGELGVSSVLEGSVRKAGTRLRITAQLIDVGSQGHVWAKTYDRELDDVFAVQADIANQVADALKTHLRAAETAPFPGKPGVRPESYLAYLKGRSSLRDSSEASLKEAKTQFMLAISLDPENAAAHSGLAYATRMSGWFYSPGAEHEWEPTSRRLAMKAVELDPNLAEAHSSLALILWDDCKYGDCEREYTLALSLNPSDSFARVAYAFVLEDEGRAEEALLQLTLAREADPLWTDPLFHSARLLGWLRRFDEALAHIQKLGELTPDGHAYHSALAEYYLARSEIPAAITEMERAQTSERSPRWKTARAAFIHALAGKREEARAIISHEETLPRFPFTAWAFAIVCAELGDLDGAFRWLERARNPSLPLQAFRLDPRLESMRSDPRFAAVLRSVNLA
jgi:adenylate cyclase